MMIWFQLQSQAQGTFQNNGNGNWQNASTWSLTGGSDADGVPDSDDDVTILSGARVNVRAAEQCQNLTLNGRINFPINSVSLTVTGNMTVSGTNARLTGDNASRVLNVDGDFNVTTGNRLTIRGQTVTVAGTTTLDGTLRFSNNTSGTKTFADIDVNASGTWDNSNIPEDFTFTGNVINDGTWNGCSNNGCDYTLTSTSGTFSGSGTTTVSDFIIDGSASYTNNGTIAITDDISGTGTFINGSTGTLEFQGAGPFTGTSTFTLSTAGNTVVFGAGGSPEIFAASYYNLSINKSGGTATPATGITVANDLTVVLGNLDIDEDLTISNDVIVQGGVLEVLAANLVVSRDLSVEGGEFTPNNASADVDITRDLLMSTGTYDHNNGAVDVTGDLTITGGTMDMDGGTFAASDGSIATGTLTWDSGTIDINNASGNLSVNSGSLDMNGAVVTLAGTLDINGGTVDLDGGTLNVVNADIETGDLFTVSNATLSHTGTMTVNGTMTFDNASGSYTLNNLVVASGGDWNVTSATDFTFNGNIEHNGSAFTACNASGCDYTLASTSGTISGSSAFTITDIIINGSGSYTNTGNLTVSDRLTGTGTFTNGANGSLTYTGNNNFDISSFSASATGNTVTYGRAGDQDLRPTTDANSNYYNLVINSTTAGNDMNLTGNIRVDNQLTLTTGDIILGSNRLTMADGATISGGGADSFIQVPSTASGVLRQNYSATGATLAFPIGDDNDYSPITAFTITSGTFSAGAYAEFQITDDNHPNRDTGNTGAGGDDDGTAATAYISRYWTVAGSGISDVRFDASYQYLTGDITGTESDMVATIYRTHPSLGILDWLASGTVDASTNTVSLSGADAFGDLYAMDDQLGRLPIVLLSFEAETINNHVRLSWTTASEEDNELFTIERSTDAIRFEAIAFVDGAGNSETLMHYNTTDVNPPAGRIYYRLKQTDYNGTFEYSEIISVQNTLVEQALEMKVFGNPVQRGAQLLLERSRTGEGSISLVSSGGSPVLEVPVSTMDGNRISLDIPTNVNAGLYLLVLQQEGQKVIRKLILN